MPAWCLAALVRGDEVIVLRLGASLRKRLTRVTALLEAELRLGCLTYLERLTFGKAESRLRKSRRDGYTARRRALIARGAHPVFRSANGGGIVRLTSRESLADEGSRMRDREGRARVTLEVDDGQVLQVKGFANGAVAGPDRVVLRAFIRKRGYQVKDDRHNLFLRHYDFRCKPQALECYLRAGGLELLRENRYAGLQSPAHSEIKTLLCQVIANGGRLAPETLECVYRAIWPDESRLLRLRRRQGITAYGLTVGLEEVMLPLPFLNLVRFGVFRDYPWERQARCVLRQAECELTDLALAAPDRLFALGPQRNPGDIRSRMWDCPADLLADARVDVSSLRAGRHAALRRQFNRAKRRALGRRALPAKGHLALRRLLDGAKGYYVL